MVGLQIHRAWLKSPRGHVQNKTEAKDRAWAGARLCRGGAGGTRGRLLQIHKAL